MAGQITWSILDNSNEVGRMRMYTPTLDAANIADYTNDSAGGALGDMRLALNPLIDGNHLKRQITAQTIVDSALIPADTGAQRERKALVTYRDTTTGKTYRLEIPTFSMVGVVPGTDVLDLTNADWVAFVTQFESNFVSELGNAVQVVTAKHVGRAS